MAKAKPTEQDREARTRRREEGKRTVKEMVAHMTAVIEAKAEARARELIKSGQIK
jgi:hypothetical protein